PAPPHVHGDYVDDCQRALDDSRKLVAARAALPPLRISASPPFCLVLLLDLGELFGSPVFALDVLELAGLLRALTLGVDVGLVAGRDRVAVDVDVEIPVGFLDRTPTGEFALLH